MSVPKSAVASAVRHPSRTRWHLIYFVLAAFDLLAVACGLYLSHGLMGIYARSVSENQIWAERLSSVHALNDLAASVNAPANDVFDTKDAIAERIKRDAALATFHSHLSGLEAEFAVNTPARMTSRLDRVIVDIRRATLAMNELADRVFDLIATDEGEKAGEYMATMDRRYADVTRAVTAATRTIQDIQRALFQEQLARAEQLRRYEYGIGLLIILMVAGVMLYGHKLQQVMASSERALADATSTAVDNETRFRGFAATASDWFWETDAEHRFSYISQAADRNLDVTARLGRHRWDIAPESPEARAQMAAHRADLEAHRPFRDFLFTTRLAGEATRVYQVSGNPIFDAGGNFQGYRGTGREVSAMLETNRKLAAALEGAREAAALQKRFISITAHEFRTPITIIDGAAQRLLRNADAIGPADIRVRAAKIREAGARMAEIVDRTLNSARLAEGRLDLRLARIDLVAVVAAAIQRQESISADFKISFASSRESLPIDADAQLLDQVITNLLSNAVKYAGTSRRIDVELGTEAGSARLSVRDFGVGVPADELPNLFTRFFRASTAKGIPGTGIGLHLVKELVAMHGGDVAVASPPGSGTRFTVTIPIEAAASDATIVAA